MRPGSAHSEDSGLLFHTRAQEKEQQLAVEEPDGEQGGAVKIIMVKKQQHENHHGVLQLLPVCERMLFLDSAHFFPLSFE